MVIVLAVIQWSGVGLFEAPFYYIRYPQGAIGGTGGSRQSRSQYGIAHIVQVFHRCFRRQTRPRSGNDIRELVVDIADIHH